MSYIRNFLSASPINRNGKEAKLLKSCFYFFSLEAGCRMIAVFEALLCVLHMYMLHQEGQEAEAVREVRTSSTELADLMVTREPEGDLFGSQTHAPIFMVNPYFTNALSLLTLLNALLLVVGTELSNISCLILWLCITILTRTIDTLIHIMQGNDLQTLFFVTFSLLIKIYFCAVVASLILKLQHKLRASLSETEVLYKQCEET